MSLLDKITSSRRLQAFGDKSAWLLMAPAFLVLYLIDHSLAITLLQWSLYGVVLAGAAIVISRAIFPGIHLSDLIENVKDAGCLASGVVIAAIVVFVGLLMIALALWSRAG